MGNLTIHTLLQKRDLPNPRRLHPSIASSSSAMGEQNELLAPPCWNVDWLDLMQALGCKHSWFELMSAIDAECCPLQKSGLHSTVKTGPWGASFQVRSRLISPTPATKVCYIFSTKAFPLERPLQSNASHRGQGRLSQEKRPQWGENLTCAGLQNKHERVPSETGLR